MFLFSLLLFLPLLRTSTTSELYFTQLTTKGQIMDFFYHSPNDNMYGWIAVAYCAEEKKFAIKDRCKHESMDTINQRVDRDKYQFTDKGLFIELDPVSFNDHYQELNGSNYNKRKNIIGLPVAHGPNGNGQLVNLTAIYPPIPLNEINLDPNRPTKNLALMFGERARGRNRPDASYTTDQLKAMSAMWKLYPDAWVVFDAAFLAGMSTSPDVKNLFLHGKAIVYQAEGQPIPHFLTLKRVLVNFFLNMEVKIMLPGDTLHRIQSFVPNIAWGLWPANLNRNTFYDFREFVRHIRSVAAEPKFMLMELQVKACSREKGERVLSVLVHCEYHVDLQLRHMLESVDPDTIALVRPSKIEFLEHAHLEGTVTKAFVLTLLARGPNYERQMELDPISRISQARRVNFVLGLHEKMGKEKAYHTGHVAQLAEMMEAKQFEGTDLGVRLRIDFLCNVQDVKKTFAELISLERWKWLFLHDGRSFSADKVGNLTRDQLMQLKKNIRLLDRETFLVVDHFVRQMLYVDEEINKTMEPPPHSPEMTEQPITPFTTKPGGVHFPTVSEKAVRNPPVRTVGLLVMGLLAWGLGLDVVR